VRCALLGVIGGMAAYSLYAGGLIRPDEWGLLPDVPWAAPAALVVVVLIGALIPIVAWRMTRRWRE
jgi:branched-subunit amino acid ABC-type transport system permease component